MLIKLMRHAGRRRRSGASGQHLVPHRRRRNARELHGKSARRESRARPRNFEAKYPDDYPDAKLAGKTYDYSVEVQGIKEKKLPELNDEFAKDAAGETGGVTTLAELRKKIHENLEAAKEAAAESASAREDSAKHW